MTSQWAISLFKESFSQNIHILFYASKNNALYDNLDFGIELVKYETNIFMWKWWQRLLQFSDQHCLFWISYQIWKIRTAGVPRPERRSCQELCQSSWHWAQTTTISCKAAAKNIQKDLRFALFVCTKQTQSVHLLRVWTKQIILFRARRRQIWEQRALGLLLRRKITQDRTKIGGSLQRSSFLVAKQWVLHLEQ